MIVLNAGELAIIESDEDVIWSVLGSCITVIFHVPGIITTACHAQHPARGVRHHCSDNCPHPCYHSNEDSNDFKFVKCAIEYMVHLVKKKCINIKLVHTILLGGASTFAQISSEKSVGTKNLLVARATLKKHGIVPDRELVGGSNGMNYRYFTKNNRLVCKIHSDHTEIEVPLDMKITLL